MSAADASCLPDSDADPQVYHSAKHPGLAGEDAGDLAKAEQRCANVLAGAAELDLKGLNIVSLPRNIDFTSLAFFDCSYNKLTMFDSGRRVKPARA